MYLFLGLTLFFLFLAVVYAVVADLEPVGTTVFALLAGLTIIIAAYLWILSLRMPARPSDREDGEIAETAGEYGTFAPHSWWPLVLGIAASLAFLGPALGWWLTGLGVVVTIIGLVGHLFEFSRGQHAH
ncbi:MAG: cytochrome c oxidase subunit 4 [Ruaniaceae bacterium]|nr:cytochrome c oxidase subunit 4 [Ruaniaceae bacterium]